MKDVSRRYPVGNVEAVHDVSLSIEKGEFVALLGPSGCGKSTLLNLIGAIDRPTSGTISLDDQCITNLDDAALTEIRRSKIGFVFQFFNLLGSLTVAENISIPLELNGVSAPERKRRVDELLDSFGLSGRAAFYPSQLSGGEMQRVAIARAIVHRPSVIIADEPTGNLDAENGAIVLELLARLNKESQTTIIMATHSKEASDFASRVVRILDGKLSFDSASVAGAQTERGD